MHIKQFYDTGLAHASYAIASNGEVAVIDPGRDPQQYYDYAQSQSARIVAVIETHPHADFVSSHLEIHRSTGATIYASDLIGADYPHKAFDEGDRIGIGAVSLTALNTPGHSPDSISILLRDSEDNSHAVFTGDTLFVGDVGRPDLREGVGNMTAKKEELARQMYSSTRRKLMTLDDDVLVYPSHGAGSLCGKNLSPDRFSSIGREKRENYALQTMSEEEFVERIMADQPFMPKYFGFDVELNRRGAANLDESCRAVPRLQRNAALDDNVLVIDTRPGPLFKLHHIPGAINIQDGGKFETWLGSIVGPDERFYLVADDEADLDALIRKAAKIGYEGNIVAALPAPNQGLATSGQLELDDFRAQPDNYTIVDIRNEGEFRDGAYFNNSVSIPLPELRERAGEVALDKPIVVHCAAGYRSAAGASILEAALPDSTLIYDLGEKISLFK